jgi:hypothetical protein
MRGEYFVVGWKNKGKSGFGEEVWKIPYLAFGRADLGPLFLSF